PFERVTDQFADAGRAGRMHGRRPQVEVEVALTPRGRDDLAASERARADQFEQLGAVIVRGHLAAERLHLRSCSMSRTNCPISRAAKPTKPADLLIHLRTPCRERRTARRHRAVRIAQWIEHGEVVRARYRLVARLDAPLAPIVRDDAALAQE